MSKQTLKFDSIEVNKNKNHASKQPIGLYLVDPNEIKISDKFKNCDNGFKYFIGYKDDNIVGPLCITLPQVSGYMKYFENRGKNLPFIVKDDSVLDKYHEIWNKIKKTLNTKLHSMPVYDEK